MARFAPLPIVSIDPRTEAQLVQEAAQTVYEASNRTLNDFSSGNPLAVLLEGQAFAQGEFLFWANQLPQKILIEWIGPFLGAMRKLGTPSLAQVVVTISPSATATVIPEGATFTTNSQLTGGESFVFTSNESLTIPAGETTGKVLVYSKFVGSAYNVPANTITGTTGFAGLAFTATNPEPATGGTDVESFEEVQARFFSLIRRKNPVSQEDWQNFFIDLYGPGTQTSVQPARSSEYKYNYAADYIRPNGQVSFFVLGPGAVELTTTQLILGQKAINAYVPIETQGHLYPITLSQVQYNLELEVDPNGTYGSDFRNASYDFRNRLYSILLPGSYFPMDINPTVSEIDTGFYGTFNSSQVFRDPRIISSSAYNTPNGMSALSATYTNVHTFEPTDNLLSQNDLVVVNNPNPTYFPVLSSFTPYSISKFDQTIYGNLTLKQIKEFTPGVYYQGDIVYHTGVGDGSQQGLHVVLENLEIKSPADSLLAIYSGKVSAVKNYEPWNVGTTYEFSSGGVVNPDIVEYDYSDGEFTPATPASLPLNQRPGSLAWLVTNNFTLEPATNDVTGATSQFLLGSQVVPQELSPGASYTAGTWVFTPQVGSGPSEEADPYYNYIDPSKGALVKFAYVNQNFSYTLDNQSVYEYFNSLVSQGVVSEVQTPSAEGGLPIYKYKARFKAGQYLEYRESATSTPSYYIAAQFFTPNSGNIDDLLNAGLVFNLAPTPQLSTQLNGEIVGGTPGRVKTLSLSSPGSLYSDGTYTNVPTEGSLTGYGLTLTVVVSGGLVTSVSKTFSGQGYTPGDILTIDNTYLGGTGSGVAIQVNLVEPLTSAKLNQFVRMFTFFSGDKTFFRVGSSVQAYTAVQPCTPLFDFNLYYTNGVFVKSEVLGPVFFEQSDYIPFFDPKYAEYAEDTILSEDGRNFYRVLRAFSPSLQVASWGGGVATNTARYQEFSGNLLRYVSQYSCEVPILPQSGKETSAIKLGVAQITVTPKSSGGTLRPGQRTSYIWENTQSSSEVPELSWYTGTQFVGSPPSYGNGTLAL